MKIKYLHHHMGLGDHFCCNGMVLELIKRWNVDKMFLFCWEHNLENLKKLYFNKKVELIPLKGHTNEQKQVNEYLKNCGVSLHHNGVVDWLTGNSGDYYQVGFSWMENECHKKISQQISCDQCFYMQTQVPYELRFDGFCFNRDIERENQVYAELNPNNEEYVFVAIDDISREMVAPSRKCLNSKIKIIDNPKNYSIMDLGKVLENASELHLMESSIRCLIEAKIYNMNKPKLNLHAWRGAIWGNNSIHDWNLIWQDCSETSCTRKYPMYQGPNNTFTIHGYNKE